MAASLADDGRHLPNATGASAAGPGRRRWPMTTETQTDATARRLLVALLDVLSPRPGSARARKTSTASTACCASAGRTPPTRCATARRAGA